MKKGWSMQLALHAAGLPQSIVTPSMAADYLGLNIATVRGWVQRGLIKAWGTPWGCRYYVDLAEILVPVAPDVAKVAPGVSREEWNRRRLKGIKTSATFARKRAEKAQARSTPVEPSDPTPEA